jgi:NAD(P)-dependent dehydrogenase (short-subunit alcohol dehydrogenase family)
MISTTPKIALVTGAGSGIGRAVALALAKADYTVILVGRRLAPLEEVAGGASAACIPMTADITDENSVRALFAQVEAQVGRLDLLFNNAGTAAAGVPIDELPITQWRGIIDTNLTGAFLCTQAAFRLMKTQEPRGGRIINNGSISAVTPRPLMVAYTTSKHAITGLTKSTSLEGRRFNIACGQIDIGNTATTLASGFIQGTLQADFTVKPEPTFDVRHVADAVLYMAGLPLGANVLFMTIMATQMPFVGRG